jgi:hypothetical protein
MVEGMDQEANDKACETKEDSSVEAEGFDEAEYW